MIVGLTNLTWVTAGFGWIAGIVPIVVAAPFYFGPAGEEELRLTARARR